MSVHAEHARIIINSQCKQDRKYTTENYTQVYEPIVGYQYLHLALACPSLGKVFAEMEDDEEEDDEDEDDDGWAHCVLCKSTCAKSKCDKEQAIRAVLAAKMLSLPEAERNKSGKLEGLYEDIKAKFPEKKDEFDADDIKNITDVLAKTASVGRVDMNDVNTFVEAICDQVEEHEGYHNQYEGQGQPEPAVRRRKRSIEDQETSLYEKLKKKLTFQYNKSYEALQKSLKRLKPRL